MFCMSYYNCKLLNIEVEPLGKPPLHTTLKVSLKQLDKVKDGDHRLKVHFADKFAKSCCGVSCKADFGTFDSL